MTDPLHHPRCLIVTSGAEGELALALAFLREQSFAAYARTLIPTRLYQRHKEALPVPVAQYSALDDILAAVETHQPDIVALFSAYFFHFSRLLTPRELNSLLHRLRARGCVILTSDPILGLSSRITPRDMDPRMLLPNKTALRRLLARIAIRLVPRMKVLAVPNLEPPGLDDLIHVYPTTSPENGDGITRVSFFNPAMSRVAPIAQTGTQPVWLFILSETDLHVQRVLVGLRDLVENLLGLLRHSVDAGRQPTLVAPPVIASRLRDAVPGADILSSCPHADFERRVMGAEYVFSWNAFSFSLLPRLASGLPVFFFDRGYFARAIAPYYALARSCHFAGWEPAYVDQRQLFSPYVLAHLAKSQKPALEALRQRWQASPTPDALLRQLAGKATLSRPA